ncbi:MAG: hypothetical protein HEQ35_22885 [Gloeotrichia echinulata IR180]|jgi:hypothetical protein|nr:hypothetical protein [Gloeotrichia echinulata DEX184]
MNAINKIYLPVLVQRLQRENLICSYRWVFQPALSAVYSIGQFSPEERVVLASKYQRCNSQTDDERNYPAPEQMAIGTSP